MLKKLALICFLILILPACTHKKTRRISCIQGNIPSFSHDRSAERAHEQARALLHEWETTLLDIPFPLGAMPVDPEHTQTGVSGQQFLAYTVSLSESDLVKFYEQEMERLGWQKMTVLRDFETMLIFAKPDRICSISLRAAPDDEGASEPVGQVKGRASDTALVVLSLGKKTQALSFAQEPGFYDEDLG